MKGRGKRGWGWERVLLSLLVSFNRINVLSTDQWRIVQTDDPAHTMLDLHPPTSKSCPLNVIHKIVDLGSSPLSTTLLLINGVWS